MITVGGGSGWESITVAGGGSGWERMMVAGGSVGGGGTYESTGRSNTGCGGG